MYAERIKELREKLGLSQKSFGDSLGTSRDVIANIEYGKTEPKKVFLDLICTIHNVNSQWLTDGTGDIFIPALTPDVELEEAMRLFIKLSPKLRKYALQQIKGLLEVQQTEED